LTRGFAAAALAAAGLAVLALRSGEYLAAALLAAGTALAAMIDEAAYQSRRRAGRRPGRRR